MTDIPTDLSYTAEHEWVSAPTEGNVVRVGITDFAQQALGDVVYAQLPEMGTVVSAGEMLGEVESTKSVSEVYAPLSGEIVGLNETIESDPSLINSDPYGEGWLLELRLNDVQSFSSLLSAAEYEQQVG